MVRSPILSKVTVTGISPLISSALISFPFSSSSKKPEQNSLQKSLTLNIKPCKDILKEVRYVYRIGHGTTHLRTPYIFRYSVADTPPPSMQKTRGGGERWLTPISFECASSFFYPREPIAHQIIMTMVHLRKKNKKKSSSTSRNPNYNQVNFEEMDDFISIESPDTNYQENLVNTNRMQRQISEREQKNLLLLKLKGTLTNKWSNGARR